MENQELAKIIGGMGVGGILAYVLLKEFFKFFGDNQREKLKLQQQQFEAWQEDRKRIDALVAGNQQNNQAIAVTLGDLKDNQHRIVATLEKISESMNEMEHRMSNVEREVMLEVQSKRK